MRSRCRCVGAECGVLAVLLVGVVVVGVMVVALLGALLVVGAVVVCGAIFGTVRLKWYRFGAVVAGTTAAFVAE